MSRSVRILIGVVVVFAAIQLVPITRDNPPVEEDISAPPQVAEILHGACYDCHSNETVWPWYSHVAPVSWLLAHDVHEAREHVNFSTWNRYDAKKRIKKLDHIQEELDDDEMPPWFYRPLHPKSQLDESQLAILHEWTSSAR